MLFQYCCYCFHRQLRFSLIEKSLTMETESNVLIDTPIFCHDLSTVQEQTKKKFLLEYTCWLLAVGGILVWRIVDHRQMHHNSPDPLHHPLQHPLDLGNPVWGHQPWGLLPTLLKQEYPNFFLLLFIIGIPPGDGAMDSLCPGARW